MKGIAKKYFRWSRSGATPAEEIPQNGKEPKAGAKTEMRMDLKLKQIESDLNVTNADLKEYAGTLLSALAKAMGISQGAFFVADKKKNKNILKYVGGYAYALEDTEDLEYEFGEGLTGQVASDGKMMEVDNIPEGYLTIVSGLGQAAPASILIFPVVHNKKVLAVIELASFKKFLDYDKALIVSLIPSIVKKLQALEKMKK